MRRAARVAVVLAGFALAVVVLFTVVFPWVDRQLIADPVMDLPAQQEPAEADG